MIYENIVRKSYSEIADRVLNTNTRIKTAR
jgi:hypothetical protein